MPDRPGGPGIPARGRGTSINPPNRFERLSVAPLDPRDEVEAGAGDAERTPERAVPTVFFRDSSKSVLARNDSPDLPFRYSLNPYRGCEHGCSYCYARPSHEYLGFSAGLDFETKILVKDDAPALLRREMSRRSWSPQLVALCGNTDPYQPVERRLRITRGCLEVFLEMRNPVGIITKNALVLRDLDLIAPLAAMRLAAVTLSITTMRPDLARRLEPRTSSPERRFEAVEKLAAAGVSVSVFVAPVIPGLNDHEIPAILAEAAARGASRASYTMLRLAGAVEPVFLDWLRREYPEGAAKVEGRLREMRGGKVNDPRFGTRMTGEGETASAIRRLFELTASRLGLDREGLDFDTTLFRRPSPGQGELFDAES